MTNPKVTVIVLTFNEEANLPGLIGSINGLDCRTLVVDSFSTDRTLEIARAAGFTIAQHKFENYSAQRNWAQGRSAAVAKFRAPYTPLRRVWPMAARPNGATGSTGEVTSCGGARRALARKRVPPIR